MNRTQHVHESWGFVRFRSAKGAGKFFGEAKWFRSFVERSGFKVGILRYGGFLKWWYPTTMGFPTKNDHFGVFWGYHHLRKHPYILIFHVVELFFRNKTEKIHEVV